MKKKLVKKKLNIIFFGRKDCKYSNRLILLLKSKSNLTTVLSNKKNEFKNLNNLIKKKIDYIFCFRSYFIIKENLLRHVSKYAINFHPGSPVFRGIGCANFALIKKAKKYGSTCHLIDKKIDNGKILDVILFRIGKKNINNLLSKTYNTMYFQAKKIIQSVLKDTFDIQKNIKKNKNFKWSKKLYKNKDLENLYKIDLNIKPEKLSLVFNSTITKKFKPYIQLNKEKIYLG